MAVVGLGHDDMVVVEVLVAARPVVGRCGRRVGAAGRARAGGGGREPSGAGVAGLRRRRRRLDSLKSPIRQCSDAARIISLRLLLRGRSRAGRCGRARAVRGVAIAARRARDRQRLRRRGRGERGCRRCAALPHRWAGSYSGQVRSSGTSSCPVSLLVAARRAVVGPAMRSPRTLCSSAPGTTCG